VRCWVVLLDHDPVVFSGSRGARTHKRQFSRHLFSRRALISRMASVVAHQDCGG